MSRRALATFALFLQLTVCRYSAGGDPGAARGVEAWLASLPPRAGDPTELEAPDLAHAWLGTSVARRLRGEARAGWERDVLRPLVARQDTSGERCGLHGSWRDTGDLGARLGRVGSTALAVLTLSPPDCYGGAPSPCLVLPAAELEASR